MLETAIAIPSIITCILISSILQGPAKVFGWNIVGRFLNRLVTSLLYEALTRLRIKIPQIIPWIENNHCCNQRLLPGLGGSPTHKMYEK